MNTESKLQDVIKKARAGSIESIQDGPATYVRRYVSCGKKRCRICHGAPSSSYLHGHGPYWYLIGYEKARRRETMIYIGRRLDTIRWRRSDGSIDFTAFHNRFHSLTTKPNPEGTYQQ